jgi:hypothetical protein
MWFLMSCALAALIGGFGTPRMGDAGDTIADRELGQMDVVHNGLNLVDGIGLVSPEGAAVDTSVSPNRLYVVTRAINGPWDGTTRRGSSTALPRIW